MWIVGPQGKPAELELWKNGKDSQKADGTDVS